MARHGLRHGDERATRSTAERIAQVLVLDMVLWPGALFAGGTVLLAWELRDAPLIWPAFLLATFLSVAVGIRQWGTMLAAVRRWPTSTTTSTGARIPRPTGRGMTEGRTSCEP